MKKAGHAVNKGMVADMIGRSAKTIRSVIAGCVSAAFLACSCPVSADDPADYYRERLERDQASIYSPNYVKNAKAISEMIRMREDVEKSRSTYPGERYPTEEEDDAKKPGAAAPDASQETGIDLKGPRGGGQEAEADAARVAAQETAPELPQREIPEGINEFFRTRAAVNPDSVTVDLIGGIYRVTWIETDTDATKSFLYKAFDRDGKEAEEGVLVLTRDRRVTNVEQLISPQAATLSNGNFLILWRETEPGDQGLWTLRMKAFAPTGKEIEGAERLLSGVGSIMVGSSEGPPLGFVKFSNGTFALTWNEMSESDRHLSWNDRNIERKIKIFDSEGRESQDRDPAADFLIGSPKGWGWYGGKGDTWALYRLERREDKTWQMRIRVINSDDYTMAGEEYTVACGERVAGVKAVTLPNGNTVILWEEWGTSVGYGRDPNTFKIRAFDEGGKEIGGYDQDRMAADTFFDPINPLPAITTLSNGNFVVVWRERASKGAIFLRIKTFTRDGKAIEGGEYAIEQVDAGAARQLDPVRLPPGDDGRLRPMKGEGEGELVEIAPDELTRDDIYVQTILEEEKGVTVLDADAALAANEKVIEEGGQRGEGTAAGQMVEIGAAYGIMLEAVAPPPQAIKLSNGNFAVIWLAQAENRGYSLEIKTFTPDGKEVEGGASAVPLGDYGRLGHLAFRFITSVTTLDNGNFVIQWQNKNEDGNYSYHMKVFDPRGKAIEGGEDTLISGKVGDDATITPYFSQIEVASSHGQIAFLWIGKHPDGRLIVRIRRYDSGGRRIEGGDRSFSIPYSDTYRSSRTTKYGDHFFRPRMLTLSNGNILVAWEDIDNDIATVRTKTFTMDGEEVLSGRQDYRNIQKTRWVSDPDGNDLLVLAVFDPEKNHDVVHIRKFITGGSARPVFLGPSPGAGYLNSSQRSVRYEEARAQFLFRNILENLMKDPLRSYTETGRPPTIPRSTKAAPANTAPEVLNAEEFVLVPTYKEIREDIRRSLSSYVRAGQLSAQDSAENALAEIVNALKSKDARSETEEDLLEATQVIMKEAAEIDEATLKEFEDAAKLILTYESMREMFGGVDFGALTKVFEALSSLRQAAYEEFVQKSSPYYTTLAKVLLENREVWWDGEGSPLAYFGGDMRGFVDSALKRMKALAGGGAGKAGEILVLESRLNTDCLAPAREAYLKKLKTAMEGFSRSVNGILKDVKRATMREDASETEALFVLPHE